MLDVLGRCVYIAQKCKFIKDLRKVTMPSPVILEHPATKIIESLRFLHSADLSPDGGSVAWCRSSISGDNEIIELLLAKVDNAPESATVLVEDGRNTDPEFSPDGLSIAFLRVDDGGVAQIHVYEFASGVRRAITELAQGVVGRPRWSPDGAHIAFTASEPGPDRTQPFRITRANPWLDGAGLADDAVNDVWVVSLESGETRRLTRLDSLLGSPEWHPTSDRLSVLATSGPREWNSSSRLYECDLEGNTSEVAAFNDGFSIAVVDGGHAFTSIGFGWTGSVETSRPTHGSVFTLESGVVCPRSGSLDVNGDVIADAPIPFLDPEPKLLLHGDDALVRVQHEDRLSIYRVPLRGEGEPRVEIETEGCAYPLAVRGDRLLYGSGDRLTAPDLRVRDFATGDDLTITDTAAEHRTLLTPLRVENFRVQAPDGAQVQTVFLAPADSSGPLPTVLLIHGGPETAFGEALFLDAQLLCEAGLGVLLVNPRGSRGYGLDFMAASRGDWGGMDADDFMRSVDAAVERGLADPDRLGVGGLSFGGYMTSWFVANSDRFQAAVAENGVTNMVSMYGTSDVGLIFIPEMLGGSIETAYEQYVRSSPVTNAEKATTPTLFIVGTEDHRCPPEQSIQMYRRLVSVGCEAEMVVLPGASHVGSTHGTPAMRRAQNNAMARWFADRL